MGKLMKHRESLSFFTVIPVHDDDVLAFVLRRLAGFIIAQVMNSPDLRVRRGGQPFNIDRDRRDVGIPHELAGLQNDVKLVHLLFIVVKQSGQTVNVPAPLIVRFRAFSSETHLMGRLKKVQGAVFIFDKDIDELLIYCLADQQPQEARPARREFQGTDEGVDDLIGRRRLLVFLQPVNVGMVYLAELPKLTEA
jgi:hypothetical protein